MRGKPSNLIRYACPALLAVTTLADAQLPSESVPVFIDDERKLVGRYRFEEEDGKGTFDLYLNADYTASIQATSGEDDDGPMRIQGFWKREGSLVRIHNQPGPARLEPIGLPTRVPSIGLRVVAINVDGSPAKGLGVTWPDAPGLFLMTDGDHQAASAEVTEAVTAYVMRSSDRTVLQTIQLVPGGPNSFRFTYHPSDEEPFDISLFALDGRAGALEMEAGTSHVTLRRIPN